MTTSHIAPAMYEECGLSLSAERIAIHMRIPAERSYLGNALLTLREICDHLDITPDRANRIILALEEGLLNSMEHAYSDSPGVVDLQFAVEGPEFTVVIEDFGHGLAGGHATPDLEADPVRDRGRGLTILQGMADKVTVTSEPGKGTRSSLLFYLPESAR